VKRNGDAAAVLAHELAHAEYSLENPERLAQLVAAQRAMEAVVLREPTKDRPSQTAMGRVR
jgi:hypothetical protein